MNRLIQRIAILALLAFALPSCTSGGSCAGKPKIPEIRGATLLDDSTLWNPTKVVPNMDSIQERDWAFTAQGRMNTARLAVKADYFMDSEGRIRDEGFAFLDRQLAFASKYGLQVVLDMHIPPGGAIQDYRITPENQTFWQDEAQKQMFVAVWKEIAQRYARDPRIMTFELMNEPSGDPDDYWELMTQTIKTIRETDQSRRIIVHFDREGKARRLGDTNLIYSFHFYEPMGFTHQALKHSDRFGSLAGVRYPGDAIGGDGVQRNYDRSSLKELLSHPASVSTDFDAPVIIGEFGVSTAADEESKGRWIEDVISVSQDLGLAGYLYWRQIDKEEHDLSKVGNATMAVINSSCYASPAQFFGIRPDLATQDPGFDFAGFYRRFGGKKGTAQAPCTGEKRGAR